ncbi:MAG TPA: DUF3040 domain-containing protein [Trebonia sp.]|jgi:hypothetical protein|nr:DUF3040 domain-containing protein [Trebonia sp.]
MGGVVPLSEHEQRQLEQIEQALYREDRRLARLVRSSDPRVHYKRRVVQAAFGFAVGAGLVAAGVVLSHNFYLLSVSGFVVMLLSALWALSSWRHVAGVTLVAGRRGRAGAGAGERRAPGRKRQRRGSRQGTMMERFDERWRRRQEGDR